MPISFQGAPYPSDPARLTVANTFRGQLEFTGLSATNDTSGMNRLLSDYETMINGNEFCQLVTTTSQQAGVGSSGGSNLVTGMQATVTTTLSGSASCYTGESVLTHQNYSGGPARTGALMDLFFHGVMLRVEANTNWVLRINFGVGNSTRVPPAAGVVVATARQWGVEFYYDGANYVGRMYWYDTSINYGTAFTLPTITADNWANLVYSMRMRQTASGLLEFYINTPAVSLGGGRLSDTPTATMQATWTSSVYGGRYMNFEAANGNAAAATTGVRIHCSTIYGRFKA